jgi:hypothetical protein
MYVYLVYLQGAFNLKVVEVSNLVYIYFIFIELFS